MQTRTKTVFVSLLFAASQTAIAGTINFDDLVLFDFDDIPMNYADHGLAGNGDSRVGVAYSGANGTTTHLDFWNDDYGDLSKVAFTPTDGTNAKITLIADPGWLIQSVSFDMAGWPDADLPAVFGHLAMDGLDLDWAGTTINGFSAPFRNSFGGTVIAGSQTATIEWGTDWNIGIDNIVFEVIADPGRVPEPATLALLGLGLAGLGFSRRKQ